jgi:hypothetical protein
MGFQTQCGVIGCYPNGYDTFAASSDPAFCAAITPGTHAASFWAAGDGVLSLDPGSVELDAVFYAGSNCSGLLGSDSLGGSLPPGGAAQELIGALVAPPGTQSVLFSVSGAVPWVCDDYCGGATALVDDVYVEDTLLNDTTPPESSIDSGPFGTTNSTSGTFDFTATEHATFECSLDAAPFSVCTPPASYDGLADGSHTFSVRATDMAGNIEQTPAERTWTIDTRPLTITSFTPTSEPPGTSVSITGTGFIDVRNVAFNGAPGGFTVNSPTSITALVPKQATTGPISVQTTSATAMSSSLFTVTCASPGPIIDSVTPTSGPIGAQVSITGENFTSVTQVAFTGELADFTIDSPTSITATVPSYATSGPIRVETYSSACTSSSPFTVTWPAPTISSFTPTSGPTLAQVDIQGTSFHDVTRVMFNGKPATTWQVDSLTNITTWVPSGATTGPISVTASGQTGTSSASFTVTASPPSISSFTPASGPVGTSVDVQGTNLTGATSVKFNGTPDPSFVVNSSTDVTAHVPAGATSGPISVTSPGGTANSSSSFTVTASPPTISSFTPSSGPVGTGVDIQGTNFTGATRVTFNGASDSSFAVNSATDITAHVPAGATTGPITVTTPSGTATSPDSFTAVHPPPTITGFVPTSGHAGQQVTITGSNFTGATSATLGTTSATFTVSTSSSITAVVPNIPRGPYTWSVTSPVGTGIAAGPFHVK